MDALDTDGSVNETYGFVTQVDLVTEETDVTNCNCDYLYPYNEIHLGNGTIECDNVSYNVSSATTIGNWTAPLWPTTWRPWRKL